VHVPAHRLEHVRDLAERLDADLEHPAEDPHATRIPRSEPG
jgi:Mn-dependent DtxR family transcriptional regulator